jgi:hypothetical protein
MIMARDMQPVGVTDYKITKKGELGYERDV